MGCQKQSHEPHFILFFNPETFHGNAVCWSGTLPHRGEADMRLHGKAYMSTSLAPITYAEA
jgi:hypothetical protein